MTARLPEPVDVSTCIACGARSRAGDCPDGCDDVPIDLIDLAAVEAARAALEARRARVSALRHAVMRLAEGTLDARELQAALRVLAPPLPETEIIEAWGCPDCGRIDAPQPCLGVCVRRPVMMADAAEYRALAEEDAALDEQDRRLSSLVRLAVAVRPRPHREAASVAALSVRARAALQADSA